MKRKRSKTPISKSSQIRPGRPMPSHPSTRRWRELTRLMDGQSDWDVVTTVVVSATNLRSSRSRSETGESAGNQTHARQHGQIDQVNAAPHVDTLMPNRQTEGPGPFYPPPESGVENPAQQGKSDQPQHEFQSSVSKSGVEQPQPKSQVETPTQRQFETTSFEFQRPIPHNYTNLPKNFETPLKRSRIETPMPLAQDETSVRQRHFATSRPKSQNGAPVRQRQFEMPNPQSPLAHYSMDISTPVPKSQAVTLLPKSQVETPMPRLQVDAPVLKSQLDTPVIRTLLETPVLRSQLETPVSQHWLQTAKPQYLMVTPIPASQVELPIPEPESHTAVLDTPMSKSQLETLPELFDTPKQGPSGDASCSEPSIVRQLYKSDDENSLPAASFVSEGTRRLAEGPSPLQDSGFQRSFNEFVETAKSSALQLEDGNVPEIAGVFGVNCQLNDATRFRNITIRQSKTQNIERREQPRRKCQEATPFQRGARGTTRASSASKKVKMTSAKQATTTVPRKRVGKCPTLHRRPKSYGLREHIAKVILFQMKHSQSREMTDKPVGSNVVKREMLVPAVLPRKIIRNKLKTSKGKRESAVVASKKGTVETVAAKDDDAGQFVSSPKQNARPETESDAPEELGLPSKIGHAETVAKKGDAAELFVSPPKQGKARLMTKSGGAEFFVSPLKKGKAGLLTKSGGAAELFVSPPKQGKARLMTKSGGAELFVLPRKKGKTRLVTKTGRRETLTSPHKTGKGEKVAEEAKLFVSPLEKGKEKPGTKPCGSGTLTSPHKTGNAETGAKKDNEAGLFVPPLEKGKARTATKACEPKTLTSLRKRGNTGEEAHKDGKAEPSVSPHTKKGRAVTSRNEDIELKVSSQTETRKRSRTKRGNEQLASLCKTKAGRADIDDPNASSVSSHEQKDGLMTKKDELQPSVSSEKKGRSRNETNEDMASLSTQVKGGNNLEIIEEDYGAFLKSLNIENAETESCMNKDDHEKCVSPGKTRKARKLSKKGDQIGGLVSPRKKGLNRPEKVGGDQESLKSPHKTRSAKTTTNKEVESNSARKKGKRLKPVGEDHVPLVSPFKGRTTRTGATKDLHPSALNSKRKARVGMSKIRYLSVAKSFKNRNQRTKTSADPELVRADQHEQRPLLTQHSDLVLTCDTVAVGPSVVRDDDEQEWMVTVNEVKLRIVSDPQESNYDKPKVDEEANVDEQGSLEASNLDEQEPLLAPNVGEQDTLAVPDTDVQEGLLALNSDEPETLVVPNADEQEPSDAPDADGQEPLVAGTDDQEPLVASADEQEPSVADADEEEPLVADADEEDPLVADADEEEPLEADADEEDQSVADADEEDPLVADADEEEPLVADADEEDQSVADADEEDQSVADADEELGPLVVDADEEEPLVGDADEEDQSVADADEDQSVADADEELEPLVVAADEEEPLVADPDEEDQSVADADEEEPLVADADKEDQSVADADEELEPLVADADEEEPLVANADGQEPLVANADEQEPLVADADGQEPLVAAADEQEPAEAPKVEKEPVLVANPDEQETVFTRSNTQEDVVEQQMVATCSTDNKETLTAPDADTSDPLMTCDPEELMVILNNIEQGLPMEHRPTYNNQDPKVSHSIDKQGPALHCIDKQGSVLLSIDKREPGLHVGEIQYVAMRDEVVSAPGQQKASGTEQERSAVPKTVKKRKYKKRQSGQTNRRQSSYGLRENAPKVELFQIKATKKGKKRDVNNNVDVDADLEPAAKKQRGHPVQAEPVKFLSKFTAAQEVAPSAEKQGAGRVLKRHRGRPMKADHLKLSRTSEFPSKPVEPSRNELESESSKKKRGRPKSADHVKAPVAPKDVPEDMMPSVDEQEQKEEQIPKPPLKRKLFSEPTTHRRGLYGLRETVPKTDLFQIKPPEPKKKKAEVESSGEDGRDISVTNTDSVGDTPRPPAATASVPKLMEPTTEEQEPLLGKLVWGRFGGHRWWPGIIIRGNMCYLRAAKYGSSWIYWFGDHKVSEVAHDKIRPFTVDFCIYLKKSTSMAKTFHKAVIEAIQACGERAGFSPGKTEEELVLWAENGFKAQNGKSLQGQLDEAKGNQQLPDFVIEGVAALSAKIKRSKEDKEKEEGAAESEWKPTRLEILEQRQKSGREDAVADIRSGRRTIRDTCLACTSATAEVAVQHPFFEGGLCEPCKEELMDTMFAFGADGTGVFCIICGNGGDLFVCDKTACNRVYCTGCIVALVAPTAIDLIHKTDPWLCFMCSEHKPETHGLLIKKANWKQNVHGLFSHIIGSQPPTPEDLPTHRMRVLSLFDGIGTGKFVLDQLGFDVESYYASEIDQDAINVTKMQHKDNVTHLGDVRTITVQKLNEIGPIDLLIGGSPCNELSLCNPTRKGLGDGTGLLFFEFYRILNTLQKSNQGRHLFWLFENVVSMPKEVKSSISRFFGCEPAKLNSKYFSAQQRARYFWGNLPGIYCPPQLDHFTEKGANLNNVLTPFCNRVARFEKVQTVTTHSNSFRQGHKDSRGELPVMMDGKQDGLWIPEVERLFGFPSHYTDIGYLGPSKRQKLIGKSWSIGVIRHLFTPLKQFFALKEDVESGVSAESGDSAESGQVKEVDLSL